MTDNDGLGQMGDTVVPPPMNRMVTTMLALVGFFVAAYLWAHNAGLTGPIVCGIGDCATVQSSEFATIGPVPVSAIGVAGYVALIVLSFLGLQPGNRESRVVGGLLLAGSTIGVSFSAYLTYLEAAVINAWCQYCVVSAILMTLIFLACLPEIGRLKDRSSGKT
jgi:uncharacterized membrane protein